MKIIYLEQKEVKIGDKVSLHGVEVTVTQQLIDDLPNLFKVEEEQEILEYVECTKLVRGNPWPAIGDILPVTKPDCNGQQAIVGVCMVGSISYKNCFKPSTKEAWLLQEAKRRYPEGTKFTIIDNETFTSDGEFEYKVSWRGHEDVRQTIQCTVKEEDTIDSSVWDSVLGWAEIVKPLFITEDGVEIFEGDEYFYINDSFDINVICAIKGCQSEYVKARFSTREAAEEYIAKHREKTLKDYEKEIDETTSISGYSVYRWLKDNDRKLYYTKVLQLIADDLNDGKCVNRIFIKRHGGDYIPIFDKESLRGTPMFASKSDAMKAIKIMNDKLDLIYKN